MLLRDIVNGKEPSSCIILQDSLEASARPLMLSFMKSLLDRVDFVCLVCFELPPCRILNVFKTENKSKLLQIDGFSNYLQWDGSDNQCDNPQLFFDSNITDVVKKAVNRRCSMIKSESPVKVAIVIDSISKLINKSVSQTCQMLHCLSQGDRDNGGYIVDQVISIVHSDLHDSQSLETLCSIASSVLHILPSMVTPHQSDPEYEDKSDEMENSSKTLHIKKTGKVLKKKQKYTISSHQFELTEFTEEDWIPKAKVQPEAEKQASKTVDPLSDLTFNLKLTKREEQDRANTHLPYMHHAPPAQVKIHQNQVKESQIFYQPDEADDFDEDDPDDDLDI